PAWADTDGDEPVEHRARADTDRARADQDRDGSAHHHTRHNSGRQRQGVRRRGHGDDPLTEVVDPSEGLRRVAALRSRLRNPPGHWKLLGACLVLLGALIALTFDDGPDPQWTPKILELLRRERVPGTFFMIGSQAARHADLVRDVERAGEEIGNHTFTHAGMSAGPGWLRRAEVELTEAVLVGITGHYPRF